MQYHSVSPTLSPCCAQPTSCVDAPPLAPSVEQAHASAPAASPLPPPPPPSLLLVLSPPPVLSVELAGGCCVVPEDCVASAEV